MPSLSSNVSGCRLPSILKGLHSSYFLRELLFLFHFLLSNLLLCESVLSRPWYFRRFCLILCLPAFDANSQAKSLLICLFFYWPTARCQPIVTFSILKCNRLSGARDVVMAKKFSSLRLWIKTCVILRDVPHFGCDVLVLVYTTTLSPLEFLVLATYVYFSISTGKRFAVS